MKDKKKMNLFKKIKNFFVEYKIEIKKIVWPTQKTVLRNTAIVLTMIVIIGLFVAALDTGLMKLLSYVMSVGVKQ